MPRDHAELEIEPFAILIDGVTRGDAGSLETALEPLLCAFTQLACFIEFPAVLAGREARKNRLVRARAEGAPLRDFHGMSQRLRHVAEQLGHLGAALETVLGRQLTPVAFCEQPAFGNADQRIVCFVVLHSRKIRLVGGDQRHAFGVGKIDQRGLTAALGRGAVALQFDVEPVAE